MRIGAMSNYLAEQIMNAALRNTPYTSPVEVFVALHTTDPTKDDTGAEVTGGSYARMKAIFSAPEQMIDDTDAANPVTYTIVKNTADLIFPKATAAWGIVTHVTVRDAATGGKALFQGPLENPKAVDEDDLMVFLAGDLVLGLN